MEAISPDRLEQHLRVLTHDIGVRLAGMPGEAQAADYVAEQLAAAGATVTRQPFPVNALDVTAQQLEILVGDQWLPMGCSLFSNTPGTGGQLREAELVFFEAPTGYQTDLGDTLRGKAVVHLGCHIESRDSYRRLIAAEPACLLMVDIRYPGHVPLADGMFPAYTRDIGAVSTLNVAYHDAWDWHRRGAARARWRVDGGMRPATSGNVIGDLPGTDPDSEILYLSGHHDTQADSVGADDNGTGTVGILELARVLAPLPRRRTIRLIAFGAEEQLSVGSAVYARACRDEIARRRGFIFNLDSYGSRLGWNLLTVNGPPGLTELIAPAFHARGERLRTGEEIVPYGDHFPLVAAGIPGAWLHRPNCAGGRWYHHRADDNLDQVCTRRMANLLEAVAALTADWVAADALPFECAIPPEQAGAVEACWTDLFGGW